MRSKLFVPASRPDRFRKALHAGADAICIDLEDSVLPSQRASARTSLVEFLASAPTLDCQLTVRVNSEKSDDFEHDLAAAVHPLVTTIVLPKVSNGEEILRAVDKIAAVERIRGIDLPRAVLPTIETAEGLRRAHEIAAASPRVSGLQLGFADLLLPMGIDSAYPPAREYARWMLRLAAAESGLPCFESAYMRFSDQDGFRMELYRAKALGFSGASCIHPSQVPIANKVFGTSDAELARAAEALRAGEAAQQAGQGASVLGAGELVDLPVLEAARRLLDKA